MRRKREGILVDVELLYKRYGPMVLRRCRQLLHAEDRALDAMQESFVRLLSAKTTLDERAPSSLLYCIATNVCLNVLRSERRLSTTDDHALLLDIASDEDLEAIGMARNLLDRIFGEEMTSTRVIATLHYVDSMTLEETAEAVGLSVSGVRKRLKGLRSRIKAKAEAGQ